MKHFFVLDKYFPIILSLLLWSPLSHSATWTETDLNVKTTTGRLHGTLTTPDSHKAKSIVLIIAGSGPTDRNGNTPSMTNNSLRFLAYGLAERGIASIRYDKRGVAESVEAAAPESDIRLEHFIEDAKSWLAKIESMKTYSNIAIAGHSQGSLIGMVVAQEASVDKFVSIAGAGHPISKVLSDQLKNQPDYVVEAARPILERLNDGKVTKNVPDFLITLFRPSVQNFLISWVKYDPQAELKKLNKPILIIQGTTDIQVGVSEAKHLIEGNSSAQLVIIKGMNHVLKNAPLDRQQNLATYKDPNQPVNLQLIDEISYFIKG